MSFSYRTSGRLRLLAAMSAMMLAGSVGAAFGQTANAKGKISRNFYRIPYGNTQSVRMNFDYVDHGNTPAGDTGSMDMRDQGTTPLTIVAAAAGTVTAVNDTRAGCGCHSAYGPCANSITIQHANNERTLYLHIAQNSATNRGIVVGSVVTQGQAIATEGDIGWTCGNDRAPVGSTCSGGVPAGATNCGRHLHWNIQRITTGERVNPMTCGISNNIYVDDTTYTANACNTAANACTTNQTLSSNLDLNGFGGFRVFQASDTILVNASSFRIRNFGSMVMHAGKKVTLKPGFLADSTGYFRAEIGNCNTTAPNP